MWFMEFGNGRPGGLAMSGAGRGVRVAVLMAVLAEAVAACAAMPDPNADPLLVAQRHLRQSRQWLTASCELLGRGDRHAIDGYYVACEEAWNASWTCPGKPDILGEAGELYADALAGFLEASRQHGRLTSAGIWVGTRSKPILVPFQPRALPIDASAICSIEPQAQRDDGRVSRRHVREGFGLPVVVRLVPAEDHAERQSLAATAVLRFRVPGGENRLQSFAGPAARDHAAAVLDLANPVEIAAVHIGPIRTDLAADLTAPLLDVLAAKPRTSSLEGFVRPFGRGDTQPRLELLEPHQPGRIPVVFIHGLASDEGTWFDMINELRSWPTFHRAFEPWVFHYPTGAAFLPASAALRRQLAARIREIDPSGTDPALRNVVLVGHSMGGLHAKLQVVAPGDALWNVISTVPFDGVRMRPEMRALVAPVYFFEPAPFVNRVVFIATPHKGSILASLGVGRLASLTVKPPAQTKAMHDEVVRLNPGAFRPEFERAVPTTIDLLEPGSSLLQTIEGLRVPCWVTCHSIVGNGHHSLTGGRDDCVVNVSSAHTPYAASEIQVPATHTKVHHHPTTIAELKRILVQHLAEIGR